MKRYKIATSSGDIEFTSLSAEDTDSYYHSLLKGDSPFLEEYIFNIITENKYLDVELSAGIIPQVVFASLKLSGFTKGKYDFLDMIDATREAQDKNNYFSIYARIVSYLPSYKLDELRDKTFNELIELLIFTEAVAGKQFTDTKKTREVMAKEEASESKNTPVKKGIKGLTKQDLDAIKNAINYNDSSNMI